jgi:hypothetical protein
MPAGATLPNGADGGLPFVDEHVIRIAQSRERVWTALQRQVAASLRLPERGLLARTLRTEPPEGFRVTQSVPPERLTLAGRHRFSRYQLTFELTGAPAGPTDLCARTHAAFPGVRGRAYRMLVIGTRGHVVATRRILAAVRRRSLGQP